jgi:hypothetical protein
MNVFCLLFGHTWVPETRAPTVRWNTTKEGHVLNPTMGAEAIQHLEVCRRCALERAAPPRRHDSDRPTLVASATGEEEGSGE